MRQSNWLYNIEQHRLKKYSQTGEEGFLLHILANICNEPQFLVDLGAGDGITLSNTRLLIEEYGFSHILLDANNQGNHEVHEEWITAENVCDLLRKYDCPMKFTLLSVDLDGNDFDVIKAVCDQFQPTVIVCEINGTIPLGISKKIVYNPEHVYQGDDYYGFSFSAAVKLADLLGYRMIYQNDALNAYLINKDVIAADLPPIPRFKHDPYHKHNPHGVWETV